MIVFCYGYTSFAPFSVSDFFIYYTLLLVGKFYSCSRRSCDRTNMSQLLSPSSLGSSSSVLACSSLPKLILCGSAPPLTTTS